jgi:hypothetical protein
MEILLLAILCGLFAVSYGDYCDRWKQRARESERLNEEDYD